MKKNFFYLLFILPIFNGCFLMTSLQDGNTLGKKNVSMTFSAHGVKGTLPTFDPDYEGPKRVPKYRPVFQYSSRFGVSEKLDLGFKLNNSHLLDLTSKYQLIGSRFTKHGLSTGLDVSIAGIHIPLYYSYRFDPSASIYVNTFYSPFFIPSININSGFILGQSKTQLALEFGYQRYFRLESLEDFNGITFGVGILHNFGKDFNK